MHFFGKMSIQIFSLFFLIIFFNYIMQNVLYIFWIQVLDQICGLQVFSPTLWLVFYSLRSCSFAKSCPSLCNRMSVAHQVSLSFTISQSLPKIMSTESVMLSNHLTFCLPFLLLPSVFHIIRVFFRELSVFSRWPKYWNFSFRSVLQWISRVDVL